MQKHRAAEFCVSTEGPSRLPSISGLSAASVSLFPWGIQSETIRFQSWFFGRLLTTTSFVVAQTCDRWRDCDIAFWQRDRRRGKGALRVIKNENFEDHHVDFSGLLPLNWDRKHVGYQRGRKHFKLTPERLKTGLHVRDVITLCAVSCALLCC